MVDATPRQRSSAWHVNVRVPAGPGAPASARDALGPVAEAIGRGLASVELVVSELVTNAVRHSLAQAGEPIEVDVRCAGDRVRVSVTDPGPGFVPPVRPPKPGVLGGWGLFLVDEVAAAWHVERGRPARVIAEI